MDQETIDELSYLKTNIIGKTIDEAKSMCKKCLVRETTRDGKPLMVTMDYRSERINVSIQQGIIKSVINTG